MDSSLGLWFPVRLMKLQINLKNDSPWQRTIGSIIIGVIQASVTDLSINCEIINQSAMVMIAFCKWQRSFVITRHGCVVAEQNNLIKWFLMSATASWFQSIWFQLLQIRVKVISDNSVRLNSIVPVAVEYCVTRDDFGLDNPHFRDAWLWKRAHAVWRWVSAITRVWALVLHEVQICTTVGEGGRRHLVHCCRLSLPPGSIGSLARTPSTGCLRAASALCIFQTLATISGTKMW